MYFVVKMWFCLCPHAELLTKVAGVFVHWFRLLPNGWQTSVNVLTLSGCQIHMLDRSFTENNVQFIAKQTMIPDPMTRIL